MKNTSAEKVTESKSSKMVSVFISKNFKKILEILARFYGEIVRFNAKASCQNGNQNIFSRF